MSNIALLLQAGMAIIMASVVIPMCVLRLLHRLALEGKFNRCVVTNAFGFATIGSFLQPVTYGPAALLQSCARV